MVDQTQGQPASVQTPPLPGDGSDQDPAEDTSKGYTIEINVAADNSITVSVEPKTEEDAEEQGGADGADSDEAQSVASIREACKLVQQIYAAQGEAPDTGADDAAMEAGYKPGM